MFKTKILISGLAVFLLLGGSPRNTEAQKEINFPVSHFKLKNGFEVILSEDSALPLASVVVAYNVGSINDPPGKTGLAYLMQKLMFQGSADVSPMQHISLINKIGGKLNAAVSETSTLFYQTVPSNQLALVLWLESDRMEFLDITASKVEQAKLELIDEIVQRKANEPYLETFFAFDQVLFPDSAYSHPLVGTEEDVMSLTLEDIQNFYYTFYTPNNAVLCVAGNINKVKVIELILKYFETIPRGKDIPTLPPPKIPEKKQVVQNLTDSLAPSPAFHLGFRISPPSSSDFYTLTILDYILSKGKSSRFYKRLFKRERMVSDLSAGIEKRKNFAVFKIFAVANNDIMIDRSQKAIFSELDKIKTSFIPQTELIKAKNIFKMDYIDRFSTSLDKAIFLSETYFSQENFEAPISELNRYLAVTPSELVGIANRYFREENSLLLTVKIK